MLQIIRRAYTANHLTFLVKSSTKTRMFDRCCRRCCW